MMIELLLAAGLLAPAGAAERPGWLSGESPAYPKASFILGLGEAATQERAADKARAEIAKAFGVQLTARTEVSAKETADKSGSSWSESVEDEVRTSTASA
jgi:hypothetical protein